MNRQNSWRAGLERQLISPTEIIINFKDGSNLREIGIYAFQGNWSGFESKKLRSLESLKLLNWGFRNTNTFEISKKGETTFELDTWLGKKNKIKATTKEDYYITINKKNINHLNVSLEYDGPISAPVDEGTQIANIIVTKKNEIIKKLPLYGSPYRRIMA